jgi:hypothetical protein
VVFLLWGKFAQEKQALIDETRHFVLKAAHPPFSVDKGFFGCKHFSKPINYSPNRAWIQSTEPGARSLLQIFAPHIRIYMAIWGLIGFFGYHALLSFRFGLLTDKRNRKELFIHPHRARLDGVFCRSLVVCSNSRS